MRSIGREFSRPCFVCGMRGRCVRRASMVVGGAVLAAFANRVERAVLLAGRWSFGMFAGRCDASLASAPHPRGRCALGDAARLWG